MKKQKGFTLIEIMISLVLGLIVIGGALSIYISTVRSSTDITNSARLNYDLDSVMQLMVNDIRRAGYWGGADTASLAINNPFTDSASDANIIIDNRTGEADDTCILYTYDADNDGILDANEYFGFRLNGFAIDITSSATDCDDGGWESIVNTDKVSISTLTFSNAASKCLNITQDATSHDLSCAAVIAADASNLITGDKVVETRQIDILLEGEVENDNSATKSLSGIIKVRNDRIFIQ